MAANGWIIALHLLGLFFWVGNLLALSRILVYHVRQAPEVQANLCVLEKRLYLAGSAGGVIAIATGLLMLFGAGNPHFNSVGDSVGHYLKPRSEAGGASFWYVTFHVKLVSVFVLLLCDGWLARQLFKLSAGDTRQSGWPLAAVVSLVGFLVGLIGAWLPLAKLGVPDARTIGYGVALVIAAVGFIAGRKFGAAPGSARFSAIHGAIAALVLLIVVLMIAKPLSAGVT